MLALLTYRLTYYVPHFGMRTYKKVGSDPELLACYQVYQRFSTTLKLDWLFQLQLLAYVLLGTAVPNTSTFFLNYILQELLFHSKPLPTP